MDTPIPSHRASGYVQAALACAVTTLLTLPLRDVVDAANIVMIYLLVVALVAIRLGSGPAVLAAFGGVALFDFFFVPPHFSMAVADAQYLITFAVMCRNARTAADFFGLPPNQVVELGTRVML